MIWIVFVCFFSSASSDSVESRLVNLTQGPVRGYKDPNTGLYMFYNIPYATAPTGLDKFKAPLPPPVWSETFEAVDQGVICPQSDLMGFHPQVKNIQEQCLIANVYVPDTDEKDLPVVVYVHGGAYVILWGEVAKPTGLVQQSKRIIAVTFNYRLEAHGFLCLGTKEIPGNAGMKDQVALLRWVKNNIASFGGDPEQITLAGLSAGSSSADLLMLSKMANGLFKRVIPESGANTAPFTMQFDPVKNARDYAKLLNFDKVDDIHALQQFFQTVPYDILNSGDVMNRTDSTFLLAPCVERYLGEETFLEESPIEILRSGKYVKLPMLYGFTNMEGLFRISLFDSWKHLMNKNFADFLPADVVFRNEAERRRVAETVRRFYFGNNLDKTILSYVKYFTDVMFAYATLRSAKLQVEAGNDQIYLYEYSYVDGNTAIVPHTKVRGADHCAQSFVILEGVGGATDENHTKAMRDLWINFIIYGQPILNDSGETTWPPVGANWSPYMSLSNTMELKNSSLLKTRALFWENIYDEHYRYPIPPRRVP